MAGVQNVDGGTDNSNAVQAEEIAAETNEEKSEAEHAATTQAAEQELGPEKVEAAGVQSVDGSTAIPNAK